MPIHAQWLITWDRPNKLNFIGLFGICVMLNRALAIPNFGPNGITFVYDLFHLLFDDDQIFRCEWCLAVEVIVPSVFDNGANGYLNIRPNFLNSTCHDMRQIMADQLVGLFFIFQRMNFNSTIYLNRPSQIKMLPINCR